MLPDHPQKKQLVNDRLIQILLQQSQHLKITHGSLFCSRQKVIVFGPSSIKIQVNPAWAVPTLLGVYVIFCR